MMLEHTSDVLDRWPRPDASLTRVERKRLRRLRSERDREDFLAAHLLAREVVASLVDGDPRGLVISQHCPRCGSTEHGRPSVVGVEELRLSFARSDGSVGAAVGTDTLGVDVERRGSWTGDTALPVGAMAPAEARQIEEAHDPESAFLRLWVRKEALVKAGAVQVEDIGGIDVSGAVPMEPPSVLDSLFGVDATVTTSTYRWGRWRFLDVLTPDTVGCTVSLQDTPPALLG